MKKPFIVLIISCALLALCSGCGLSVYNDWKSSGGQAIVGGGAIAGKDYVNGLLPSENSRKYFARIPVDNQPLETVRRSDESESQSGVKFVKNGGILIPPGVTISFTNKGYCMDPHLPAPKAGDEYQLVPMSRLIPDDLQETYKRLITKASAGDEGVRRNMQHLVWALRTAGTNAAYANNLTKEQKRILDRCADYQGQFEDFHIRAKSNSQLVKEMFGMADQLLNIKIGGVTYKASDLLDPDIGSKKINEHLHQLIQIGNSLPVEKSGFNFGEIQPGIYTDVRGSGSLQYDAKIANSTSEPFIFYPVDYIGQVGSGTKSQGMTFMVATDTMLKQRVSGNIPNDIFVDYFLISDDIAIDKGAFTRLPPKEREKLIKYAIYAQKAYENVSMYDADPLIFGNDYIANNVRNMANEHGFQYRIIQDGNDLILSIRGTEILSPEDIEADIALSFGNEHSQNGWADTLLKAALNKSETTGGKVIVTGHSLGGYLAAYTTIRLNDARVEAYTFNAPGFTQDILNTFPTIHRKGQQVGKQYDIINNEGLIDSLIDAITPGLYYDQSIDTMIKRMKACTPSFTN